MKYLLSILIMFSGLSFSFSVDELRERYTNVNKEDILLVCDKWQTTPDLKLRTLITISKKSDLAYVEKYNDDDIHLHAWLVKMKETTRVFQIGLYSINRFNLRFKLGETIMQCKIADRSGYLVAREQVILMASDFRAKRKI